MELSWRGWPPAEIDVAMGYMIKSRAVLFNSINILLFSRYIPLLRYDIYESILLKAISLIKKCGDEMLRVQLQRSRLICTRCYVTYKP